MESRLCLLPDRGVLKLAGAETAGLLQRLVTNSVLDIPAGESRFSALLSPQGKVLFDFFVAPLPEGAEAGFYFDCVHDQAGALAQKLNLHKLRAKVDISDISDALGVAAALDAPPPAIEGAVVYRDLRAQGMGWRVIAPRSALAAAATADESAYEARRVALGVPRGGQDFAYGDAFVQDVNLDRLNGVDFKKGCYVGQEVVARVHHRQSAKKRIVQFSFEGAPPAPGTEIAAGGPPLGQVGSTADGKGLAMIRLDRLEDARAAGAVVRAGETPIAVVPPV